MKEASEHINKVHCDKGYNRGSTQQDGKVKGEWLKLPGEQSNKEVSTIEMMTELTFKNWVYIYHMHKRKKVLQVEYHPVKGTQM